LFVARIICPRKLAPVRATKGVTDLRRYPDATRLLSNGYFFFFLADFFFFAFFAFLAMLPSVTPKLAQCKSTSTCIHSEYTTISKLIPSASNKVNDRHIVAACGTGRSCRVMHGHVAPCWIKRAEVLMWSEVDDGEAAWRSPSSRTANDPGSAASLLGKARSQGAGAWRADTGRAGTDFALASPRSFSFDKRSQCSASAIQSDRLAGSRFASCLHSAARKLSSSRVVIAAPPA
jgi:hypothetical protein